MMIGAIIGTIVIVIVVVVIGLFVDKKVPLLPKPERKPEPARPPAAGYAAGEVAATAIRAGAAQLAKLRETQRCSACRAIMGHVADDPVRYNERELLVLHFVCACGAKRSLYVEPLTDR